MSFTLPIGFRMGGMTLGACLGQGGFGITYLAQLDDTDMTLAVKEYFPSDFATRDANLNVVPDHQNRDLFDMGMQAFLSEANILRTLPRQPGLVRVRGAFERLGTAYCVMEYIEGDPMDRMLPRVIRARGHVPEPLIEQFVSSISAALGVVHAKGLIHRDVKPANVMIRRDGQPVLIDFGAARPYGRRQNDPAMYTRKYAPLELFPLEQLPKRMLLREGPWSDIFSLSVMLYEMLTSGGADAGADRRNHPLLAPAHRDGGPGLRPDGRGPPGRRLFILPHLYRARQPQRQQRAGGRKGNRAQPSDRYLEAPQHRAGGRCAPDDAHGRRCPADRAEPRKIGRTRPPARGFQDVRADPAFGNRGRALWISGPTVRDMT